MGGILWIAIGVVLTGLLILIEYYVGRHFGEVPEWRPKHAFRVLGFLAILPGGMFALLWIVAGKDGVVIVAAILMLYVIFSLLTWWRSHHRLRSIQVDFDDVGVRHELSDGSRQTLLWEDLSVVHLRTTSQGPYADDLFYCLGNSRRGGLVIPSETKGAQQLFNRLMSLPGFDYEKVIDAAGTPIDGLFTCWERSNKATSNEHGR